MHRDCTDSATIGLGGSNDDRRDIGAGESSIISSSLGVARGVGDVISICVKKGGLCGNGETSMSSVRGAGDDEGRGGVVKCSISKSQSVEPVCFN